MKENVVKVFFTAVGSFLSSMLGALYIPVLLLVACNLIDYGTGLMAAPNRTDGNISSYKSIRGIKKKVGQWVLVIVGAIVDVLILYATETAGLSCPLTFLVSCIVAIWLICNELISIIENLKDMGVSIPTFITPIIKNIQSQTEKKTGENEEREDK